MYVLGGVCIDIWGSGRSLGMVLRGWWRCCLVDRCSLATDLREAAFGSCWLQHGSLVNFFVRFCGSLSDSSSGTTPVATRHD